MKRSSDDSFSTSVKFLGGTLTGDFEAVFTKNIEIGYQVELF